MFDRPADLPDIHPEAGEVAHEARLGKHEKGVDASVPGKRNSGHVETDRDIGKACVLAGPEVLAMYGAFLASFSLAATISCADGEPRHFRDPPSWQPCGVDDAPVQDLCTGAFEGQGGVRSVRVRLYQARAADKARGRSHRPHQAMETMGVVFVAFPPARSLGLKAQLLAIDLMANQVNEVAQRVVPCSVDAEVSPEPVAEIGAFDVRHG